MTLLNFAMTLLAFGYLAGVLGALTGLGGGVVIIPTLVLLFDIDIHYAMGASLISVVATSSGGSLAHLKDGLTNLRIAMLLGLGTVVGAVFGAFWSVLLSSQIIMIIFGVVLMYSAYLVSTSKTYSRQNIDPDKWATQLSLNAYYPSHGEMKPYYPQNVGWSVFIMTVAGTVAGVIGIGAGALKVLAMDRVMHLPYRVSTATSNFLIGITAAVMAGIYFSHGYVQPILAFPIMLGVLVGALSGSWLMTRLPVILLRYIFGVVVFLLAIQMLFEGIYG